MANNNSACCGIHLRCCPSPPLLASAAAWPTQLLSASPLCPFAMQNSAASTTRRYQVPLVLAAVGHSTVSTQRSEGGLCVDLSMAGNAFSIEVVYYYWHWAQLRSGRPGDAGFSPPAIAPNVARWDSHTQFVFVRCRVPAKRRRLFDSYRKCYYCILSPTRSGSSLLSLIPGGQYAEENLKQHIPRNRY